MLTSHYEINTACQQTDLWVYQHTCYGCNLNGTCYKEIVPFCFWYWLLCLGFIKKSYPFPLQSQFLIIYIPVKHITLYLYTPRYVSNHISVHWVLLLVQKGLHNDRKLNIMGARWETTTSLYHLWRAIRALTLKGDKTYSLSVFFVTNNIAKRYISPITTTKY